MDTSNTNDTGFPRALLQCLPQERLQYFKDYAVAHTRMEQTFALVLQAIREPANAAYIVVVGPTGVGKTTLRLGVERSLIGAARADLAQDPGRLPVCSVTAVSPDTGSFNWKDYYRRALHAMHEPLLGDKIPIACGWGQRLQDRWLHPATTEAPALRRALEQALVHRRPQAFIVDEAQHLLKMASGRRLQDQMDSIKSLADQAQTLHVLIGTYDLLALQTLSGQVIRRGITLHFPRYRADLPADVIDFQRILVSFEQQLPMPKQPDLLNIWPYCLERSVGCVGVLKDWLIRALASALAEDAATVTQAHLARHALSAAACERLVGEALHGEEQLTEHEETAVRLRLRLGLEGRASVQHEAASVPTKRPRRPGDRRPTRDPIQTVGRHAS
jgi:hypothetical protein